MEIKVLKDITKIIGNCKFKVVVRDMDGYEVDSFDGNDYKIFQIYENCKLGRIGCEVVLEEPKNFEIVDMRLNLYSRLIVWVWDDRKEWRMKR